MDSAGERFEAVRAALADRSNVLTVKELCRLAGVSHSGYYNWMSSQRAGELRQERNRAAFAQILGAYRFRGYAKGVRGIHMRLLHMGIRVQVLAHAMSQSLEVDFVPETVEQMVKRHGVSPNRETP